MGSIIPIVMPIAGVEFFDQVTVEVGGLGVEVLLGSLSAENNRDVFEAGGDPDGKVKSDKHENEVKGNRLEMSEFFWQVFEREE